MPFSPLTQADRVAVAGELRQLRARFEAEPLSVSSVTRLLDALALIADRLEAEQGDTARGLTLIAGGGH